MPNWSPEQFPIGSSQPGCRYCGSIGQMTDISSRFARFSARGDEKSMLVETSTNV